MERLTFRADSTALGELDKFVAAFVAANRLAHEEFARLMVLLDELLTNLQKYGYRGRPAPGTAELGLDLDQDRMTVEFADDGNEFNPLAEPPTDLEADLESRPLGGFGIHLLKGLSEEVIYRRIDGRNVLRILRRVSRM